MYAKIRKETIKPQHDSLSWFGYKDLTCPCPTSTPRVSNSRVSSTINKLLLGGETFHTSLTLYPVLS